MIGSLVYGDGARPRVNSAQARVLRGPSGLLRILCAGESDGLPVVLIHGTPGSALGWSRLLEAPPTGTLLTAVDRPGFGGSEPRGAVPSLRDQAASLRVVLGLHSRPAVLVGHSLGAPIAVMAAAMWPRSVGGILLVGGAMDPALERLRWYNWLCRAGGPLAGRSIRNANRELWTLRTELHELALKLTSVRCHVSILHGARDRLVPIGNALYSRQRLSGAESIRFVELPDAGHFLPWRRVDDLCEAITALVEVVNHQAGCVGVCQGKPAAVVCQDGLPASGRARESRRHLTEWRPRTAPEQSSPS